MDPLLLGDSGGYALPGDAPTIETLCQPAVVVPGDTLCPEIGRIFGRSRHLTSVIVQTAEGYRLADRGEFQYLMTGDYGYGQMLHLRDTISAVCPMETQEPLPVTSTIADAYAVLLRRPARFRFTDLLVTDTDGAPLTLAAGSLLDAVARLNAHDAQHDSLTGLANRALLTEWVEHGLRHIDPPTRTMALLFIDMDRFKVINDSVGHTAGDRLLTLFAERLMRCIRPTDAAARLGGDEFAILVDRIGHEEEAAAVARRVQNALRAPFVIEGEDVMVTASIGIAMAKPRDTATDLLRRADIAMYEAKHAGGGDFRHFSGHLEERAQERMRTEMWLRRALIEESFALVYQPLVDLASGRLAGFEALIRGRDGDRLIPPAEFLPIAEETGMVVAVDRWMMRQAARQVRLWSELGGHPLPVAVNLSPHEIDRRDLVHDVSTILRQTGVDPALLEIEVTESSMVTNVQRASHTLRELKALGVRIAIDDFGTGYSSLAHLNQFPADILKIDMSFVQQIEHSVQHREIVRLVLALAAAMRVETVAEGIEEWGQVALLREMGCHRGQGFYFATPVSVEAATRLVVTHAAQGGLVLPIPARDADRAA